MDVVRCLCKQLAQPQSCKILSNFAFEFVLKDPLEILIKSILLVLVRCFCMNIMILDIIGIVIPKRITQIKRKTNHKIMNWQSQIMHGDIKQNNFIIDTKGQLVMIIQQYIISYVFSLRQACLVIKIHIVDVYQLQKEAILEYDEFFVGQQNMMVFLL